MLEGAWQLVYVKAVYGDKPYYSFPGDKTEGQIKMWSKVHFSFSGVLKDDSAGNNFGAGTYKLNGDRYEETLLYCSYKDYTGKTLKKTPEIKNDTLIQTSVDDNGKFDKFSYWLEKYVKL